MPRRPLIFASALASMITATTFAQERVPPLNADGRAAILEEVESVLTRMYVFPDVAAKMTADLRTRSARGEFDSVTQREAFASLLTAHLQAVSRDKHLRLRAGRPSPAPASTESGRRTGGRLFGRVERLKGDVAYIEILSFGFPPDVVREEIRSVMSAVADANALIVDLRSNGGGSPHTVALVTSYLFGEKPVHLNSLYFRPANRTDHFYTDPGVEGRKFGPDKPIYVLTSVRTFSGAEEFAYNLQTRKRAIIVGETTGGGAHPGQGVPLPHDLTMFVPTGRAINPITGTNWEGVGVKPDVAVDADSNAALETAHRMAREATT